MVQRQGKVIQEYRKQAGYTQEAFAAELGMSRRDYQRVESDDKKTDRALLFSITEKLSAALRRRGLKGVADFCEADIYAAAQQLPSSWTAELTSSVIEAIRNVDEELSKLHSKLSHSDERHDVAQYGLERLQSATWARPHSAIHELNQLQVLASLLPGEEESELAVSVASLDALFRPDGLQSDHDKMILFCSGLRSGDQSFNTSFVPADPWWSGPGGMRYHTTNMQISRQGVKAARIFAWQYEEELEKIWPILTAQRESGIAVGVLHLPSVPSVRKYDHGQFLIGGRPWVGVLPQRPNGKWTGVSFFQPDPDVRELLRRHRDEVISSARPLEDVEPRRHVKRERAS
jgi:transcriptional regulator with XRE-family HTH domain